MSGSLNYSGPIDLPQYFVKDLTIRRHLEKRFYGEGNRQGQKVEITLGRRVLNQILTTFMPTTLMCLVAFSTNFFRVREIVSEMKQIYLNFCFFQPSYFDTVVAVNITLLLVLTALFISILDSMPRTSYVKMIDIWLIFCLLIPLAEILFHAVLDKYRYDVELEEEQMMELAKLSPKLAMAPKEKLEKKKGTLGLLEKLGMFGFPITFAIFVAIFYLIGFSQN